MNQATHKYVHPEGLGFGHYHKGADLTAEMSELDLHDGTEVEHLGTTDDENDVELVAWVDQNGLDRITSIDREFFDTYFQEV